MQRAIPTRISPYMNSGWSRRKMTARANIRTGPTIQFWTSDKPSTLVFWNTFPSSSYFTFASGGYIMRMSPMAIGIDVVPTERPVIIAGTCGSEVPDADTDSHGKEDPEGQVAVKKGELFCGFFHHGLTCMHFREFFLELQQHPAQVPDI